MLLFYIPWLPYFNFKFFSDLRKVRGFLRALQFPPPIKLKYSWNIVENGVMYTISQTTSTTSILQIHFPSPDFDFQGHMSWSVFVQWIKVRDECTFVGIDCWLSLFKISFHNQLMLHILFSSNQIKVITKLPNSEQSYKGKVKTHNYINRQNQSTTGKLWKP